MIKFGATFPDGRRLLGVGLSRANCERLLRGDPIKFELEDIGGVGTLLIMANETEQDLHQQLKEFLGPDTDIRVDPKLRS